VKTAQQQGDEPPLVLKERVREGRRGQLGHGAAGRHEVAEGITIPLLLLGQLSPAGKV